MDLDKACEKLLCKHRDTHHREQDCINVPQSIYNDAEESLPDGQASMRARSVVVHVLLVVGKLRAVVNCCRPEGSFKASRETTAIGIQTTFS